MGCHILKNFGDLKTIIVNNILLMKLEVLGIKILMKYTFMESYGNVFPKIKSSFKS